MKVNEQLGLWDFVRSQREQAKDLSNGLGPFRAEEPETLEHLQGLDRNFDCSNYDRCLSFASNKLWGSFTCGGCRRSSQTPVGLSKIFGEVY